MLKKFLIAILVIILLGAGIVAYFFLFSNKKTETGAPTFSIGDFFPFGDNGTTPPGNGDGTEQPGTDIPIPTESDEPVKPPKLHMVNQGPVAGAVVYDVVREIKPVDPNAVGLDGKPLPIQTEPATMVRYIETATGHVDETYLDDVEIKKITNTTIPQIAEGFFAGKGGLNALLRYANDSDGSIQTFSGTIPVAPKKDGTLDTTLRGSYLTQDITTMSVSPDRINIFTVANSGTGSIGTISLPDGTKKTQLFSLAFTEWTSQWPSTKFVTLTTKPSVKVPGYLYSIDVTTKTMKKIIGGVLGLTTNTSPDMKNVLFSRSENGSVVISVYNITAKSVLPLPGATTLPEKCVWQSTTILYCAVPTYIPNGDYPDIWYQGGITFVDQIYKINLSDYSAVSIGNPSAIGASIDAINLSVDPANTFLIFTNKKDGALWSLDLRPDIVSSPVAPKQ